MNRTLGPHSPAPTLGEFAAERRPRHLEQSEQAGTLARLADDLQLCAARPPAPAPPSGPSALEQRLATVNPDELTPRAALELLYQLRALARDDG